MPTRRAFTAVDLLAATAALGIAAAAAQPVLQKARTTSFNITNASQHRLLTSQQAMYIAANDGAFTGATTSSWPGQNGVPIDGDRFVGNTTSATPVQQQDWITPLVGDLFGFSANRAERTQQLFETMRDPRQGRMNNRLFAPSAPSDLADFERVFNKGGFRAVSYLAPAAFQFWGTPRPGSFTPGQPPVQGDIALWTKRFGGVPNNWSGALAGTIKTPRGYLPRIDQVGTSPANKAQFADGTRYLEADNSLDINVNPTPTFLGNHVSAFFGWEGGTAYGRQGPGSPRNIELSARRQGLADRTVNGRVMYVTFFDGSTRPVTLSTAKSRVDWWAPTGSEWVDVSNIAPELDGMVQPGDLLP